MFTTTLRSAARHSREQVFPTSPRKSREAFLFERARRVPYKNSGVLFQPRREGGAFSTLSRRFVWFGRFLSMTFVIIWQDNTILLKVCQVPHVQIYSLEEYFG